MKTILFFNNKGGVGKTTLSCNIVSYLNMDMKKRVLLIDADPQCNSTQMMLSDQLCEDIYINKKQGINTLYDVLKPLEDGEALINSTIQPILGTKNNFGTDIIPGHPNISIIEDLLSDAWGKLRAREMGGLRITNWCHHLTSIFKDRYDYIVFDVGPSLGALNRTILLECDYIITPFGCDIFSLLGIKNISLWIKNWDRVYKKTIEDYLDEDKEQDLDKFNIIKSTDNKFRFAGFSVQQYIKRKFKDGERPVKAYEDVMKEIPETVSEAMQYFSIQDRNDIDYELGHIPYVNSLVPLSQMNKTPIHKLSSKTGVVGSQFKQVKEYSELMFKISSKIINNIEEK